MANNLVTITECPRDAMQGIVPFIPTEDKIDYLNQLLKAGFDRLDFGSFVSPKAIPQMRDTAEVLAGLDTGSTTQLLAIVANNRGAQDAASHERIHFLGFPFSISETFQMRNTNQTIAQAVQTVQSMLETCAKHNKIPLVYLSMGFGNPYGDPWNEEIVAQYTTTLITEGVHHIALADTTGSSTPASIQSMYTFLSKEFPDAEWGLHLHSTPQEAQLKIDAGLAAGCRHFDTAIRGFGGCPMAKDDLTGNIATETLISSINNQSLTTNLNYEALDNALAASWKVFH